MEHSLVKIGGFDVNPRHDANEATLRTEGQRSYDFEVGTYSKLR